MKTFIIDVRVFFIIFLFHVTHGKWLYYIHQPEKLLPSNITFSEVSRNCLLYKRFPAAVFYSNTQFNVEGFYFSLSLTILLNVAPFCRFFLQSQYVTLHRSKFQNIFKLFINTSHLMSGTTILVPSWKKNNVYLKEIEAGHSSSFGPPQTVNPYNTRYWENVCNRSGTESSWNITDEHRLLHEAFLAPSRVQSQLKSIFLLFFKNRRPNMHSK